MRTAIALLVMLLVGAPVRGGFYDGNELKVGLELFRSMASQRLKLTEHIEGGKALGYVLGVADSASWESVACAPANVTAGQLADVVLKYLQDHPEERHKAAVGLVATALINAFPCPKK